MFSVMFVFTLCGLKWQKISERDSRSGGGMRRQYVGPPLSERTHGFGSVKCQHE